MHDIEPFYRWREYYTAEDDRQSPFYGMEYSEFVFSKKIYNYLIHPQWDDFGSTTLYMKVLYVDYDEGVAMIEFIGEWNDALHNDIMFFKRNIIDRMLKKGIYKYIIYCDQVLNYHGDDDSYYEEWAEDIQDEHGWVILVNVQNHVLREMENSHLQYYVHIGNEFNEIGWRTKKPKHVIDLLEYTLRNNIKQLRY